MSRPPEVITADWRSWVATGKPVSPDAGRLPPGAAVSSSRTPVMTAAPVVREVACHQVKVSVRPSLPQTGAPGQYPGPLLPVQVRVCPVARLMTSTTPYSLKLGASSPSYLRDRA